MADGSSHLATHRAPVAGALSRSERAPLPDRINLMVVFGGQSAEHEVSQVTAAHVIRAADPERYNISAMGIRRDGQWVDATEAALALTSAERRDDRRVATEGTVVHNVPVPTTDAPLVVLPLLHGPNGEDGTLQGMLELAGLPYVGSGVLGSSVSMDKWVAKELADVHGIPQARWRGLHERDITNDVLDDIAAELGYPLFVKPANLGSSVGVSKATDIAELRAAVDAALVHDEAIVIEEGINGREIEIAILGNETPRTSVPGEIVPGADFYDYEDKYSSDAAELRIPAELPDGAAEQLRELAITTFRVMRAHDLARVDFFWSLDGRGWLLNEINTMPGFTPGSMYPRLWEASGLAYRDLIDELVHLALDRAAHRGQRRR